MDITQPLRLAVGSHEAGSGKGCAMNVRSWENGDVQITDLPACDDPMLARIVQRVNDTYCTHRDGDLLCAPCSVVVLDLAHRIAGSAGHGLSDLDLRRVWVRVACRMAREVLHLAEGPEAGRAVLAAERWADNPTANAAYAAADAADAAAYADAAASAAAYAAAYAASAAAYAAAYAANAAAYAANAAAACAGQRMRMAHLAVDEFYRLTGLTAHEPDPNVTHAAVAAMTA